MVERSELDPTNPCKIVMSPVVVADGDEAMGVNGSDVWRNTRVAMVLTATAKWSEVNRSRMNPR